MESFAKLVDPRIERTKKHSITDILTISICGFICGIDNWVVLEAFGEIKENWFRTFLELPNGIPLHDTFGRFFGALDSEQFSRCFSQWVNAISEVTDGEVVAIDGKTLRRSIDRARQLLLPEVSLITLNHRLHVVEARELAAPPDVEPAPSAAPRHSDA